VAANLQAVEPPRRLISVELDCTCSLEQTLENDLSLETGQGSTNAVVDAATEGDMATWQATMEVDVIGLRKHRGVSIGGSPKEKHSRPCRDVRVTKFGVLRRGAKKEAKWGLQPQRFLNKRGNEIRMLTERGLNTLMLGQQANTIAQQTGGGLASCAEKGLQNNARLAHVEHIRLNGSSDRSKYVLAGLTPGGIKLIDDPDPDVADATH
jgi:hypothetical protein